MDQYDIRSLGVPVISALSLAVLLFLKYQICDDGAQSCELLAQIGSAIPKVARYKEALTAARGPEFAREYGQLSAVCILNLLGTLAIYGVVYALFKPKRPSPVSTKSQASIQLVSRVQAMRNLGLGMTCFFAIQFSIGWGLTHHERASFILDSTYGSNVFLVQVFTSLMVILGSLGAAEYTRKIRFLREA